MRILSVLLSIFFISQTFIPCTFASSPDKQAPLTLAALVENMAEYEKNEITLVATMLGACMSGCKVWVADGEYKDGNPVALVWAKDDAFKFKTDATGQKVKLQGFAVAKYVDLCAIEKQEEKNQKKDGDSPEKDKKDCDPPVKIKAQTEKEATKELKSITFFATSVEYLK